MEKKVWRHVVRRWRNRSGRLACRCHICNAFQWGDIFGMCVKKNANDLFMRRGKKGKNARKIKKRIHLRSGYCGSLLIIECIMPSAAAAEMKETSSSLILMYFHEVGISFWYWILLTMLLRKTIRRFELIRLVWIEMFEIESFNHRMASLFKF